MGTTVSWRTLIQSAKDLEISLESVRQGFVEQAEEKSRRAISLEKRNHDFMVALESIHGVEDLLNLDKYRAELIAAASYSIKAWEHVKRGESLDEQTERLRQRFTLIYNLCRKDTENEESCLRRFRERIFIRSLLTQGETLGGSMKNWIGRSGADRLVKILRGVLNGRETVEYAKGSTKVQLIRWDNRLLLFDRTPTLHIRGEQLEVTVSSSDGEDVAETPGEIHLNNIDLILLDTSDIQRTATMWGDILPLKSNQLKQAEKDLLKDPKNYLACGELKSGNDPAGGDEHWKTAMSSFDRIHNPSSATRDISQEFHPALFFIGRAIEPVMATNIFERLESGVLSFAANLSNPQQVQALVEWLTTL